MPVIEDGEAYGYYREEGGGLLVGMFEPVAKAWALDGTPRDSAFAVLPPDWDRMAPFLEVAMQRFPALEDAGIRTLFCGPESFTDDLSPMLGESPEVDNLYLACGLNSVGILSGGGLGHMMAQWLIEEHPPLDVTAVGVDRAHEFQATRLFREERTVERLGFLLNDLAWPNAQPRLGRDVRRSPYHPQHVADGAHFVATSGWEYPDYFAGAGVTPTVEWGFERGEAFERTREEHLHARENVAIFDLSLMSHHLVQGPDAMAVLNRVCANDVDSAIGRVVYTQWLDEPRRDHRRRHRHPAGRGQVRRGQRRQHPPPGAGVDPPPDPGGRVRHRHRRDQRLRAAVGPGPEVARAAAAAEPGRLVRRRLPLPHRTEGRARLHARSGRCG